MIDEVDLMLYARQEAQLNTSIDTGLDNWLVGDVIHVLESTALHRNL
jgi:hypothetical protein